MTRTPVPDADLQSAARSWVARLVSGDAEPETVASFKAWRNADPAHAAAFDEARRLYVEAPRLERALRAGHPPRRRWIGAALAAGIAAVLLLVVSPDLLFPPDYATPDGPAQSIALEDGSRVLLDGASAIDVGLSEGRRDIRLLRGRAFFEVAQDRARPFVVSAKGGTATAVGTAFAVALDEDGAEVRVTEGLVRVAQGDDDRMLAAGEGAAWSGEHLRASAPSPDALAWRSGHVVVRNRSLTQAAEELDRYIPGRIVVLGDAADARVGGVFTTERAEAGLRALAESQGAAVHRVGPLIFISR